MAAQVDPQHVPPALGEHARGRAPGVAGLTAAVQEDDRSAVGVAELVGAQAQAVATEDVEGADSMSVIAVRLRSVRWASRCDGRP